ncbi:MAG: prepilin-type N-terminal cleavage/methylation domain-containing protein [Desulfobulbaceae bacterium]|nr:prepilin-type N-terminal cleavage/methylation domain-containing protein [Desulfobulbaceae bacterium]
MLLSSGRKWSQAGYTLVELMVAVALTGIVTVAIYKSYISVSTGYDVQDQLVEVQQNARVAMDRMVREIRMAGYDPTDTGTAGIDASSTSQQIVFSMYDDASAMTFISYRLGVGSSGSKDLQRQEGASVGAGAWQSVIQNVDALDFGYVAVDGSTVAPEAAVGVELAIVVRTSNEDYGYTDTRTYVNQAGTTILAPADYATAKNFRRRLLNAIIACRNLGM